MVLETKQWWKKNKINNKNDNIDYTKIIPSGFYIIDKNYCKNNIELKSNNKTNTLIKKDNVYKMLSNSLEKKLHIPVKINKIYKFDILSAFI